MWPLIASSLLFMTNAIHRIVLTGGPCGGKTTALARISEFFTSRGFRVFLAPEVPTILINGGLSFAGLKAEQFLNVESALLKLQIAMEASFLSIAAASGQPSIVVFDRGALDVSAYLPPGTWQALLDENDWTIVGLRDRRYDAVVHLVTAARGAEKFYTTANNTARTETPAQAAALDERLHDAWVGHPHLRVIDNSTDFAGKILRVLAAITGVVGVPEPVEVERKFLVKTAPAAFPMKTEEVEIEQTYLVSRAGEEARVRRRGQHGSHTYTHTLKRPPKDGQRVEVERPISAREYTAHLGEADPTRNVVKKRRRCFLWNSNYFELDTFVEPRPGLLLLEAEVEDIHAKLELPPFLEIEREVTAEPEFYNATLAKRAA